MQEIEQAIRTGMLPPGARLQNEMELSAQYGLSRPTIRHAIDDLVRAGLLVRKRGVGTHVMPSRMHRAVELSSLHEDLLQAGQRPGTAVVEFGVMSADERVRSILGLPPGGRVYQFSRLRAADGKPLALMENWIPEQLAAIAPAALNERSLYEILRSAGIRFHSAVQTIGATIATEHQARLLHTLPGAALVTMERTAHDDLGTPVETGRHVYRADRYSFEMTLIHR